MVSSKKKKKVKRRLLLDKIFHTSLFHPANILQKALLWLMLMFFPYCCTIGCIFRIKCWDAFATSDIAVLTRIALLRIDFAWAIESPHLTAKIWFFTNNSKRSEFTRSGSRNCYMDLKEQLCSEVFKNTWRTVELRWICSHMYNLHIHIIFYANLSARTFLTNSALLQVMF